MRRPLARQQLDRERVTAARPQDPLGRRRAVAGIGVRGETPHQLRRRVRREGVELHRAQRRYTRVRRERRGSVRDPELARPAREDQQQACTADLAGHDVQNGGAGVVRRMYVIHDQDHGALVARGGDRLEERVGEPQWRHFRSPIHRLGNAREDVENLGRDPRQLAQRVRLRAPDRALHGELANQLAQHRERQLALGGIGLRPRHDRAFHLTRRREGVGECRLTDAGVARQHDDPRIAVPHLEPAVVQRSELPLAADERLRLEALLQGLARCRGLGTGDRRLALSQEGGDPDEVAAWLRSELFGEQRGEAAVDFQRVRAVAGPGPRLHETADGVFREGIEIVQRLRMAFDGGEVADAPTGVHLPDQAVAHPRRQLGAPLILPLLERDRAGDLEAVEERPADLHVARLEMRHVRVHHARREGDRRLLYLHVLRPHFRLEDGDRLCQGMTGAGRGRVGRPQVRPVSWQLTPRLQPGASM